MSQRTAVYAVRGPRPRPLQVVTEPLPDPAKGQVQLEVEAHGVAFGDVMRRLGVGAPWGPFVPGYDVVGRVVANGRDVQLPGGSRWYALLQPTGLGGYASRVNVAAKLLVPVPEGVAAPEAVALGLNHITARQLLRFAPSGGTVLIQGISGGLGTALLDVARLTGHRVLGTASERNHDRVRARGGLPFDYREPAWPQAVLEASQGGVDLALETVSGKSLQTSHRLTRRGGTVVFMGFTGSAREGGWAFLKDLAAAAPVYLFPRGRTVRTYGITVTRGSSRDPCVRDMAWVLEQHANGRLPSPRGRTFPLHEAAAAHALLLEGRGEGKMVLVAEP